MSTYFKFLVFSILFLTLLSFAYADSVEEVKISVPATGTNFYTIAIIDKNWRVLVPLRDIIEALDKVNIQWEPEEGRVTAETKDYWCECWIGENKATANGDSVYLEAPPLLYDGRTFVPVRFIGEALGKTVEWNVNTKTITIR